MAKSREGYQPRDPEAARQALRRALTLGAWSKVDTGDPEAVGVRIKEYFDFCITEGCIAYKEALCLALGISMDTWQAWRDGTRRGGNPAYRELVQRAEDCMKANVLDLFLSGDIPTVNAIFYLKNAYGFKDQVESVVTHKEELSIASIEDIRKKYQIEAEELPRIAERDIIDMDDFSKNSQKVAESAERRSDRE